MRCSSLDSCNLLLGRPQLFDNHVIHDGRANTYEFKYMSRNLTLTQLPPAKLLKSEPGKGSEKSLFISET